MRNGDDEMNCHETRAEYVTISSPARVYIIENNTVRSFDTGPL